MKDIKVFRKKETKSNNMVVNNTKTIKNIKYYKMQKGSLL